MKHFVTGEVTSLHLLVTRKKTFFPLANTLRLYINSILLHYGKKIQNFFLTQHSAHVNVFNSGTLIMEDSLFRFRQKNDTILNPLTILGQPTEITSKNDLSICCGPAHIASESLCTTSTVADLRCEVFGEQLKVYHNVA